MAICPESALYPLGYNGFVQIATEIRRLRTAAGLSQTELARRAGTSQATLSAYESALKRPAVPTLERILAATGHRLAIEPDPAAPRLPSLAEQERRARELSEVLALAAALPTRHEPELRFPRLGRPAR